MVSCSRLEHYTQNRANRPIGTTIAKLFGRYCQGNEFRHDILMQEYSEKVVENNPPSQHSQRSQATTGSFDAMDDSSHVLPHVPAEDEFDITRSFQIPDSMSMQSPTLYPNTVPDGAKVIVVDENEENCLEAITGSVVLDSMRVETSKRSFQEFLADGHEQVDGVGTPECIPPSDNDDDNDDGDDGDDGDYDIHHSDTWHSAFDTMMHNAFSGDSEWKPLGLLATTDHHTAIDLDLGSS